MTSMPSSSIALASARMPSPLAFSERKSSSMMMTGNLNFIGSRDTSRILYHDLRECRRMVLLLLGDLDGDPARDLAVDLGHPAVRVGNHRRLAGIGLLADLDVERQRPQQLDAVILAHARAATLAEHVLLVAALGAVVQAHVLDDAEDWNIDLLEHLETLAGIHQRDVLGR